ncbi:transposase [Oceanobacillus longus]|uniref:Transposase n=1 Tax=Oceanobacillus longus TaxID=930120 RepID=A0ABV8GUN2_9BACI
MPRGARKRSISGIYHVMLRGANKQEIFHDDGDCFKFMDIVERYKIKSAMRIYAWCLMGNHVHLLLKEGNEDISNTMKRIGVSFVSSYNLKYKTVGHLFQDRFRSEIVESDRSLLRVVRYIHQNPVKAGMAHRVDGWRWSSCMEYYGNSSDTRNLVDRDFVLSKFSTYLTVAREKFREYNERESNDESLDQRFEERRRLTDEEASRLIKELLGEFEIAQVKSLPRLKRKETLQKVKQIKGLTQRQAARILGISANIIFKA